MFDDLVMLRPTLFSSTPRLFNTIYNEYKKALHAALRRLEQRKLKESEKISEEESTNDFFPEISEGETEAEVEKNVLKQFSTLLGGRVEVITAGGAPPSPAVLDFMRRYEFRLIF